MKQIISLTVAGIIGGLVVITGLKITETPRIIETVAPAKIVKVSNTISPGVNTDFVSAAAKATAAVVHIRFADVINVTLNDGRILKATKIGTDPSTDLAVIKIDGASERFPKMEYADSDQAQVGEWVLAVGSPFGYLKSTVTAGIISAIGRDLDLIEGEKTIEEFIQTDAAVNQGNSGGALVNAQGELVGINSAIATPTGTYAGYSFAIPSNLTKVIIKDIIENGDIERVNLGIEGYDVKDVKEDFNLSESNGFYIEDVYRGSAAQFGGLLPGDIIKKVDDQPTNELEDIKRVMKFNKVGDVVKLDLIRNGAKKTIKIKLRKSM